MESNNLMSGRFHLGRIIATPGALEALAISGKTPTTFLAQHLVGEWGELDEHDRAENEISIREGLRLLSAYDLLNGVRIWVITEADGAGRALRCHFHSYLTASEGFPPFFCLSSVRRNRYDSLPVSRICA